MTSQWSGLAICAGSVPTSQQRLCLERWLSAGRQATGPDMSFSLAQVLDKAISGSGSQFADLRALVAADVMRHWYLSGQIWAQSHDPEQLGSVGPKSV